MVKNDEPVKVSESASLFQGDIPSHETAQRIRSEIVHTVGFFPEIKSGLVPILGDVTKIIGDYGPND